MTYITSKEFLLEVAKGNVAGHSLETKFGRNASVPNGAWELISTISTAVSFLSAATTVRVKAGGNVNDTAGGSGAQAITIVGLDANGVVQAETLATAGASASANSSASFLRLYRAYVASAGSGTYGGANVGAITIENSAGGTDLLRIDADEGQTQYGAYTISSTQTGYITRIELFADGTKAADFRLFTRAAFNDVTTPFQPKRLRRFWDGVLGSVRVDMTASPLVLPALTDIWIEAEGAGAITEVSCAFDMLLVNN